MTEQLTYTYAQRRLEYARLGLPAAYAVCVRNCSAYFEDCPIWRAIDATAKPYDCECWPTGLPPIVAPVETEPAATAPRSLGARDTGPQGPRSALAATPKHWDWGGLLALGVVALALVYFGWHVLAAFAEGRFRF